MLDKCIVSGKKDRQYFGRYVDKFGQLFIFLAQIILTIRVTKKIVKCPINTFTILRNYDVILKSLKTAVFARRETARIHSVSTVASKFAGSKSS